MLAGFRESPRGHAGGEPVRRRQGGDVPTVDEDQPAPAGGPRHEAVDVPRRGRPRRVRPRQGEPRSEEHTSELQSRLHLVCRLLLEKKKKNRQPQRYAYCECMTSI